MCDQPGIPLLLLGDTVGDSSVIVIDGVVEGDTVETGDVVATDRMVDVGEFVVVLVGAMVVIAVVGGSVVGGYVVDCLDAGRAIHTAGSVMVVRGMSAITKGDTVGLDVVVV